MNNNKPEYVGPFTRYVSDFRYRLLEDAKKLNKVVNFKFDILSRV
jgi:c-di-AMP phosphodiesterase-like protein